MSDDRTPPWLIQLKFFALCSPVGIIAALLFHRFAFNLLLGFFVTLFVFWHGARLFTNFVVRMFDPEGYRAMRQQGCDPFYNCLGAPLNNDSESVRVTGVNPNASCPNCHESVRIAPNVTLRCPRCDAHWHENQWWQWNGLEWVLLKSH